MRNFWEIPPPGKLDRACELILERIAQPTAPPPGEAAAASSQPLGGPPQPVASVRDLSMAGPGGPLALRLYLPEPRRSRALLVWLHGGGFVFGGLDSHDVQLRGLANEAGCVVLALAYRLAPAYPFPAALEDCHAALALAADQAAAWGADPALLVVGGDSAGGNLAAGAARLCRDRGQVALAAQILLYPDADARPGYHQPSWRQHDGLILERMEKDHALDLYLPPGIDRTQPLASPALAPVAGLAGLPPALVLTAEYDPQRDEGELYATRLREAGVAVALKRYAGMIHGFWQMGGVVGRAREVNALIAEWISEPGC